MTSLSDAFVARPWGGVFGPDRPFAAPLWSRSVRRDQPCGASRDAFAPIVHFEDDRSQRLALCREGVVDARRHLREDLAVDQAALLELAQLAREHPLGSRR